jgi:glutamate N-acetyltransferase / amino-acid N-acetyltransferase
MPQPPQGFLLAGTHCGLKSHSDREDIALIHCPEAVIAAGVYTQNVVCAAPVELDRQRTPSDTIRVVIANSGNANACTGEQGWKDAMEMGRLAAEACGAAGDDSLVMSTGVIGEHLPMARIAEGIRSAAGKLGTDPESFLAAARGITTTDRGPKMAERVLELAGGTVRLAGMAKGAGMIGPRMATMLAVIMTDARLSMLDVQAALTDAVDESFNCISVEGHMSTNDTVLLLASGKALAEPLKGTDLTSFRQSLRELCIELAQMIPDDGEGASHLIEVEVHGCRTRQDARRIARTVADSPLVKCAITGGGPYWGRILSAAGYAGIPFSPNAVNVSINGIPMYRSGEVVPFDAAQASQSIRDNRRTHILLQFMEGSAHIRFWTSDLTVEYVKFNADYKT